MNQRVRERVPTPENDNRTNVSSHMHTNIPSIASGVALTAQQLATTPSIFPTTTNNSMPILGTLLLSPIKESDSVNNTLSSGSNSILPLNIKSTNAQAFGSLVVSSSDTNTKNSFVVLPATKADGEIIPVSITTVPLTASDLHTTGAIITELPVDQTDSITSSGGKRSAPATPRLGNLFSDFSSSPIPPSKNKIHRQHSVDSNNSFNPNMDNQSTSSNSTTSKRPQPQASGKKHSEVYV